MISDTVLLKKLPDSIKSSAEAYIGCLSGAVMKNEYIDAIKEAGFQDVKIVDETSFPIKHIANNKTVKAIMQDLRVKPEEVEEAASSIASIKVYGVKPKDRP